MKSKFLILYALIASIFSGCPLISSEKGQLVLIIDNSIQKSITTIEPPVDMNVASYRVSGTGPEGASFQLSGITGSLVTVDSLSIGNWQVTVEALNDSFDIIGAGSVSVAIVAGDTTYADITVVPLSGTGELEIEVSWPSGLLNDPSVSGTLAPVGESSTDIVLTVSGDTATYQNNALDAGYYTLTLVLKEGTNEVWGIPVAVRIIAGETTTGIFTLTSADIDPGNLSVTITPDMQNPFQISFLGQVQALVPGTDMTVTTTLSPSVPNPSYQWYLRGSLLLGQTGSSITVGGTLQEGNYRLDVVVESDNVLSSSGFSFTVSQFARIPVFFVHGHGMESTSFNTMLTYLEQQTGYPPQLLRTIDLVPNNGANIDAAEDQIQPAIEQFLIDVNSYLSDNHPGVPTKSQVDIISHSMGGLSSRWYAARNRPDRVRKWISLAGANHGSSVSAFADESTPGEEDMYPAFAVNETESYIQYQLNGAPGPDIDETPYGLGTDTAEVAVIAPDSTRSILYITIAATPDDSWIEPDSSVQLDGAGGVPVTIPPSLPAIVVSEGNFQMTNDIGHDPMLSDPDTIELVSIVLELML